MAEASAVQAPVDQCTRKQNEEARTFHNNWTNVSLNITVIKMYGILNCLKFKQHSYQLVQHLECKLFCAFLSGNICGQLR